MAHYNDEIKRVKELGSIDYIKTKINSSEISLRPVDESDDTIKLLTEWRNKYWYWFDKFTATEERTKKWLENQVKENHDRMLFLILLNGKKVGHTGTFRYDDKDNSAEIDNVLRGIRGNFPGLMEVVMKILMKWMFDDLQLSVVKLKVYSDNFKAINLYERCGMLTVGSIPLKRNFIDDGWRWEPTELKSENEYAERSYNVMEISKETFQKLFK